MNNSLRKIMMKKEEGNKKCCSDLARFELGCEE